jgi:hypothetical protein
MSLPRLNIGIAGGALNERCRTMVDSGPVVFFYPRLVEVLPFKRVGNEATG